MELKLIRDRRRAGIEATKRRCICKRLRRHIDAGRIRQFAGQGIPKARIARDLGISRMTVCRAMKH